MNYIKHLTGFYEKLLLDNTLNPTLEMRLCGSVK